MFYKSYVNWLGFCGNSATLHALRYASVRHASEGSVTKPPTRGRVPTTLLQHGMVQVGFGGRQPNKKKKPPQPQVQVARNWPARLADSCPRTRNLTASTCQMLLLRRTAVDAKTHVASWKVLLRKHSKAHTLNPRREPKLFHISVGSSHSIPYFTHFPGPIT